MSAPRTLRLNDHHGEPTMLLWGTNDVEPGPAYFPGGIQQNGGYVPLTEAVRLRDWLDERIKEFELAHPPVAPEGVAYIIDRDREAWEKGEDGVWVHEPSGTRYSYANLLRIYAPLKHYAEVFDS